MALGVPRDSVRQRTSLRGRSRREPGQFRHHTGKLHCHGHRHFRFIAASHHLCDHCGLCGLIALQSLQTRSITKRKPLNSNPFGCQKFTALWGMAKGVEWTREENSDWKVGRMYACSGPPIPPPAYAPRLFREPIQKRTDLRSNRALFVCFGWFSVVFQCHPLPCMSLKIRFVVLSSRT